MFPWLPAPNAMGEGMVLICVCCGAGSACRDERRASLPALAVGAHGVGSSMAGPGQDKARALHTGKKAAQGGLDFSKQNIIQKCSRGSNEQPNANGCTFCSIYVLMLSTNLNHNIPIFPPKLCTRRTKGIPFVC